MTPGDRIKERRIELGMEVAQLAKAAGIAASTLYDLERGDSQSSKKLYAIAEALGVRAAWLDTGKGPRLIPTMPNTLHQGMDATDPENGAAEPISLYGENVAYPPSQQSRWVLIKGIAAVDKDGFWFSLDTSNGDESFPHPTTDPNAYAIRIKGDQYDPAIEAGDCVLVEPSVPLKLDGRVLMHLKSGKSAICRLRVYDTHEYRLQGLVSPERLTIDAEEVEYVHFVRGSISMHELEIRRSGAS
ncbi:helix-turn-helix domain-containing protein [Dyella caseinilytica]|uniref:Helix-turn-helix domain-containing protein n=2 Tax=Dyella caseinilytica TaxID=1849581 RepID=A0ABX7GZ83_9GAMM|nr:helix-turn-helix domain-containing protein [Dyella caseinilytica]